MNRITNKLNLRNYMLEVVLIVIAIIIGVLTPGFFTASNILNVFRNVSMQGVIAFGMTMAMVCGQIDLSVGSGVAFYGVLVAVLSGKLSEATSLPLEYTAIISIVAAILAAIGVGVAQGLIHIKLKIPTMIVSLAFLNILYGLAAIISGGFPVASLPAWYNIIGAGSTLNIPNPAIILVVVLIAALVIMKYTKIGREMYAVGGNVQAAKLSGINVTKVIVVSLVAVQVLTVLSGIMVSSQVMAASSTFGKGYELSVIAATIIGGVSLSGGRGTPWGTFIGVIFFGVIANGMTLLNVNEFVQYVIKGLLIIAAVALNNLFSEKKKG